MSLWICKDCAAAYAVGLPTCPQCGSTTHTTKDELERTLPKINRTGPSYETAPGGADPAETEGTEETATEAEPEPAQASTKATKTDPAPAPAEPPASPPPAPSK